MRAGTAFLVTLAVLLAGGVAADALVTRTAEEQAAARVEALLGAPADVTLGGWPVALRLLAGRVPEVRIAAEGVPAGPVALRRMGIELVDVVVDLDDLADPGLDRLRASRGTFTAEIDEAAVADLIGMPGAVRLGEGVGQVRHAGGVVDVAVSLEDGAVVLRPIGSAPEGVEPIAMELPPLPGGPAVEQVRFVGGALRVSGRLTQLRGNQFSR